MTALFPTPSADFDHPIDILDGCHERIQRNCATLERLAAHLATRGPDEEARTAAAGVLRYFDTAGAHHHRDEEDDLFPALEKQAPAQERQAIFTLLDALRADHRELDRLWSAMRARLAAIAEGRDAGLTGSIAREFAAAYEAHIARETDQLLPAARRILDERQTRSLGDSMARRRGVARER
jgi:hemerythrin-like domain-containing protein